MAEESTAPETTNAYDNLREALILYMGQDGAELADWMTQQLEDGVPQATIAREVRSQPAYIKRFPAMKYLSELGIAPSEAEYIQSETIYRDRLSSLGDVYRGYMSTDYIGKLMMNDINPDEVTRRVAATQEYIYSTAPRSVVNALRDQYGMTESEMVAYMLDPQNAGEQIITDFQRRQSRAQILGAASDTGLSLSAGIADSIADRGYNYASAAVGMEQVKEDLGTLTKLASFSGETVTQDEVMSDQFNLTNAGSARQRRRRLASQERARFSTSSAVGNNSLRVSGLGTQ